MASTNQNTKGNQKAEKQEVLPNINTSSPLQNILNDWWFQAAIILLLGIILRWLNLDQRPFHHDESLHAIYGMYTYMNPTIQFYKYDPMLHGPFMYNHILPYIYNLFGSSTWAVRFMPAFLGSLLLFLPLFFKKYLSKNAVLSFLTLMAFSPSLVYWSRFLREDLLIISTLFAILVLKLYVTDLNLKTVLIAIFFAMGFCIKENAFLHLVLLFGFLFFELILDITNYKNSTIFKFITFVQKNYLLVLIAFISAAFIFSYIFSAGFRHLPGIIDGLYAKSLVFWATQHNIDRIEGPFIFQILMLGFYEIPLTLLTLITSVHFYLKAPSKYRWTIIASIALSIILHLWLKNSLDSSPFLKNGLKLKIPIDIYPFILISVHAVLGTFYYLKNNQKTLAITFYAFWGALFTYSYVGEKVPWLDMYPLILGLIFNILYIDHNNLFKIKGTKFSNIFLTGLALIFFMNIYTLIIVNYSRAGDNSELISQVHTSKVFEQTLYKIREEMLYPRDNHPPELYAEELWPTSWYFYNIPQYHFSLGEKKISDYDYVLVGTDKYKNELSATHDHILLSLRHWWVPDYNKISPVNVIIYLLSRRPWNSSGDSKVSFYKKRTGH